jgi:hypothetical protein
MAQSNLPTVQRLKYEDYSDAKSWQQALQQFIATLNLFVNPVYNILNGQVTYQNLTAPQIVTYTVTAATPTSFSFTNPLIIVPGAVILGNVYIPPNFNQHPAVACEVMWHFSGNTIYVDDVVGLTPGIKYTLVMVVF